MNKQKFNMNNKAKNLNGVKWIQDGKVAKFKSSRPGFGIVNQDGKFLSSNGSSPACYHNKRCASECAPYADGFKDHNWMVAK